jgi:hypothetical protein
MRKYCGIGNTERPNAELRKEEGLASLRSLAGRCRYAWAIDDPRVPRRVSRVPRMWVMTLATFSMA